MATTAVEPDATPPSALPDACGLSAGHPLDRAEAEATAALLKAVADPVRLQLLSLIRSAPNSEACVCDLTPAVGLSQPTVSHHLKVLTEAGLLDSRAPRHLGLVPPRALPPRGRRRHLPLSPGHSRYADGRPAPRGAHPAARTAIAAAARPVGAHGTAGPRHTPAVGPACSG